MTPRSLRPFTTAGQAASSAVAALQAEEPHTTPGPWIVEATRRNLWIGYPKAWTLKVSEVVCCIEIGGLIDEAVARRRANAALIAAAPSLLEALSAAPDPSKYRGPNGFKGAQFFADYEEFMATRRAVIARAEGHP